MRAEIYIYWVQWQTKEYIYIWWYVNLYSWKRFSQILVFVAVKEHQVESPETNHSWLNNLPGVKVLELNSVQVQLFGWVCSMAPPWWPRPFGRMHSLIGQKMAELWLKNVCPYMGIRASQRSILAYNLAKYWLALGRRFSTASIGPRKPSK